MNDREEPDREKCDTDPFLAIALKDAFAVRIGRHSLRTHLLVPSFRTFWTTTVLASIVLVSVAIVYGFNAWRLPDPTTADQAGLLRWVVTCDLSGESFATRAVLVRRLEEEFGDAPDWEGASSRINAEQRERLWSNLPALFAPWFLAKVDTYHGMPATQRLEYLDETLDRLSRYRGMSNLGPGDGGTDADRTDLWTILREGVAKCRAEAEEQDRQRIDEFHGALQARWLIRTLLPGATSAG